MSAPAIFTEFATLFREYIYVSSTSPLGLNRAEVQDRTFNQFALSLFRAQFAHNKAYRRICETRNLTPYQVTHWTQIPTVPAASFKELDLSCLPPEDRTTVFHSSGTTAQKKSRHLHSRDSLALYEASLVPWFAAHLIPELATNHLGPQLPASDSINANTYLTLVVLSPEPVEVPHSSLVHMFATVARHCKWKESAFVGKLDAHGNWTVDARAAAICLERATELSRTTVVLGTAFSFVQLLDQFTRLGRQFKLPAGSRVMETGGYKGRSRELSRPELHSLISERLGVPADNIVCEYGMAELSSQAYDSIVSTYEFRRPGSPARCFQLPPWARPQIVSPETGEEVSEGELGLIRVFDLANIYSVMAIQTEDLGIRRSNGFDLLGRAAKAEPRGCSLASL